MNEKSAKKNANNRKLPDEYEENFFDRTENVSKFIII